MNTLESQTRFLDDLNLQIIDNDKLRIDDISCSTYNQLSSIEELLNELKNENKQLVENISGHNFILKKYQKLIWYRKDQYINDLEENFPDSTLNRTGFVGDIFI